MAETKIISKMSVKALGCNPRKAATLDEGDQTPIRLCVVYGTADDVKNGENNDGTVWTALVGQFEGINLATNETYQSGKLFLPGGIQEVIESALKSTDPATGKAVVKSVKFGLELRAVRANNPIGYSYQAVPIVKPAENDPLAGMRAEIAQSLNLAPGTLPAIAAPATTPALPEPVTVDTTATPVETPAPVEAKPATRRK